MAKNTRAHARINKVLTLMQNGHFSEARALLVPICNRHKGDANLWYLLSNINGQLHLYGDAVAACKRVIALQPKHAGAYTNLGSACAALGRHQEAMASYEKALQLQPGDAAIHFNMGNALYLDGKPEDAAERFRRAVEIEPKYANAWHAWGNALKDLDRLPECIPKFQQALSLDPGLINAYISLGVALSAYGKLDEAAACYRRGLQRAPDMIDLHNGLAIVLRYQGKLDEMLDCYAEIRRIEPDSPVAVAGEADVYERKGNVEEAYKRVRTLIDTNMVNATVADVFLRVCRHYDRCDEAIALGKQLLSQTALPAGERQLLHYALGKLHDKTGAFDTAFEHFRQANALSRYPFDPKQHAAVIDDLIAAYSAEAMQSMAHSSNTSERPIFIVGMPRSGTTLVEQIISSHPRVFGAGELNDINDIVSTLHSTLGSEEPHPQCLTALTEHTMNQLAQRYLDRLDQFCKDALRITDKMPHNFKNLGLISLLFPGARVIHCTRDPMDTCLSIYFQSFGGAHSYATDLGHLGTYYRQYERLMKHWKSVLDLPMMTVSYEEVVSDQETVSRAMVEFCGLEWDDRCLQFHRSERKVATASYDQVRQPIYTKSICRWKHYEPYLDELKAALKQGTRL